MEITKEINFQTIAMEQVITVHLLAAYKLKGNAGK